MEEISEFIVPFKDYIIKYAFVGSTETCDPSPTNTDLDILVLSKECANLLKTSKRLGYSYTGSIIIDESGDMEENQFFSIKKGIVNIIATEDARFFDRFILASKLAKRLNLLDKSDRIDLFQTILYDNAPNEDIDVIKLA